MDDYGYSLRQKFIRKGWAETLRASASLEMKRDQLRKRMHAEGRYFLGEEMLAEEVGGSIFNPRKGGWGRQ